MMGISFLRALTTPTRVNNCVMKSLIGGCLLLIPVANLIVFGYAIESIRKELLGEGILPDYLNLKKLFIVGLKYFIGTLLLCIPFALIIALIENLISNDFLSAILKFVFQLIIILTSFCMFASFAIDEKILSMLNFKRLYLMLKGNITNALYLLLCYFSVLVIYFFITLLCCLTIIGAILTPFIIYAGILSVFNLSAQLAVNSKHFNELKSEIN